MVAKKMLIGMALVVVSILGLVGCEGEQTATPSATAISVTGGASSATEQTDAQIVTITAKDDMFDPKSYTVEADKPIKLTVTNAGQNIHNVEVEDLLPETKLAPGQSRTVDIAPQKPGTHKLYCELHEDSGMVGEFIVK